ncbi:MAG: hypothetical protein COS84_06720, partial [Armatimonadetes bacterium CG07_land_8_20_14_0_80_40_9]
KHYWYCDEDFNFTKSTRTEKPKYMALVKYEQFWIAKAPNVMVDTNEPWEAGTPFSTDYIVGSENYAITGLLDHPSTVIVRKQDSVYYLSLDKVIELIPDLSSEANMEIDYGLYYWKGAIFIPSGTNSLYRYYGGTVQNISLTKYAPDDTDYEGQVLSITSDPEDLY